MWPEKFTLHVLPGSTPKKAATCNSLVYNSILVKRQQQKQTTANCTCTWQEESLFLIVQKIAIPEHCTREEKKFAGVCIIISRVSLQQAQEAAGMEYR